MIPVIQYIILINPLVWINEAIRAIMTPQIVSMPLAVAIVGIIAGMIIMGIIAFKRFGKMVYKTNYDL